MKIHIYPNIRTFCYNRAVDHKFDKLILLASFNLCSKYLLNDFINVYLIIIILLQINHKIVIAVII